jgi:hypothetical protein
MTQDVYFLDETLYRSAREQHIPSVSIFDPRLPGLLKAEIAAVEKLLSSGKLLNRNRTAVLTASSRAFRSEARTVVEASRRGAPRQGMFVRIGMQMPASGVAQAHKLHGPAITFIGGREAFLSALRTARIFCSQGIAEECIVVCADEVDQELIVVAFLCSCVSSLGVCMQDFEYEKMQGDSLILSSIKLYEHIERILCISK